MDKEFTEGTKVEIVEAMHNYYKHLIGSVGIVIGVSGKYVVVEYDNEKDLVWAYYQDLRKIDTSIP